MKKKIFLTLILAIGTNIIAAMHLDNSDDYFKWLRSKAANQLALYVHNRTTIIQHCHEEQMPWEESEKKYNYDFVTICIELVNLIPLPNHFCIE